MRPVFIVCPEPTPRLTYVCRHIFGERLGCEWQIVTHKPEHSGEAVLIYYSAETVDGTNQIFPSGLLSETGMADFKPPHFGTGKNWQLFPDSCSVLGFDVFSAVFWVLSRYEEYGKFTTDGHGRFPHSESLLHKVGVLHMPVVDIWIEKLAKAIGVELPESSFRLITTVDIDQIYLWKHKPLKRKLALLSREAFNPAVWKLAASGKIDPFDNAADIIQHCHEAGSELIFFLLLGDYAAFDRNIDFNLEIFQKALAPVINIGKVGIHPSYESNRNPGLLEMERKRFEKLTGTPAAISRQHYLMLKLPETHERLLRIGITDDYTMGYSTVNGFRAGTAYPFAWFNARNNEETRLTLHPFEIMDVCLRFVMKMKPMEAFDFLEDRLREARHDGRPFCWAIHNESWSGFGPWSGWDLVFKKFLSAV